MTDDRMEIFSEHVQADGDDIDIDIDFTAGQADEDYILQDAQSDADYGNEFPQQSDMHHDDPMIDDDNASFQMEDADLIHEDVINDEVIHDAEPEPDPVSFASSDIPLSLGPVDTITYGEEHDTELFEEDLHESAAVEGDPLTGLQNDSHQHITSSARDISEEINYGPSTQAFDNREESANKDPQPVSHESTPVYRSPAATLEEARSPPALISLPDPSSPLHEPIDVVKNTDHESTGKSTSVPEADTSKLIVDVSTIRGVKVIYQSVEYALFATTDSDDPDSYFLKDLTIVEKPLDQFFRAIREIILDDLTDEDELCLNVEELGLETEEASSTLRDVTLAQILSLHEKVLYNDGVNSPRALYLLLGTRVSFSRRFTSLAEGISQGKGLSELVMRDDNSESIDDLNEREIANGGAELSFSSHKMANNVEDGYPRDTEVLQTNQISSGSHQLDGQTNEDEGRQGPEEDEEFEADPGRQDAENEVDTPKHHEEQSLAQQKEESRGISNAEDGTGLQSQTSGVKDHTYESEFVDDSSIVLNPLHQPIQHADVAKDLTSPDKEVVSDENNEEDDFIDYSDEEIQFPVESVEHSTADTADASTTNTEYQAKDDELRRRSISRHTEEKLLEQSIDQSLTNANDENRGHSEETDFRNAEDHIGLIHEAQNDSFHDAERTSENNLAAHHEDDQIDFSNDLETFEDEDETYVFDAPAEVEGTDDDNNDGSEVQNPKEEAELHSIPPYAEVVQTAASAVENVKIMELTHEGLAPSITSSLGAAETAETAESSVTLGAEEIQYEDDEFDVQTSDEQAYPTTSSASGSLLEPKDEIDYEDDEDEESPVQISSGAVTVTEVLSNSRGKRSIAEVESIMSTPIKNAKRPRS